MRIGKDLVLWNFFMTKFCKKARQMFFFFYSKRKSGEKWSFQKLIFPHFFVFFIFFIQHKNRKFDVDTVSKVILWHLRVLCTQLKEEKVEKNHFEHKIHWVFAGFEHKQRNIKLSYQNWNFDEKFWFSVLWEVLAGKFLMSLNFVKSWDLIQFCCTEVDTTLGLTSFEIS